MCKWKRNEYLGYCKFPWQLKFCWRQTEDTCHLHPVKVVEYINMVSLEVMWKGVGSLMASKGVESVV